MSTYDPLYAPNPQEWLALDEEERLDLVRHYHESENELPDEVDTELHAICHVTVENQTALGDETPVADTLDRLVEEGLNRHEAIHAVAGVLMEHLWQSQNSDAQGRGAPGASFSTSSYFEAVKNLTAQEWLDQAQDY